MREKQPEGEKPGATSQKPGKKPSRRAAALAFTSAFWILAPGFLLPGCAKDRDSQSARQRSENTLRDPMGYSPQFEKTDVSGGGLLDYDRDGMRKDMKNVLDP